MTAPYTPVDRLFLWSLEDPAAPRFVGTLRLVMTGLRGVSLRYDEGWLRSGAPLSEDLPLADIEYLPRERETAVGAVDDARPDRWGERVIRMIERPPRLSLLEMLWFAGDDRFGALGVSSSAERYLPHARQPLPRLHDVAEIHALVRRVQAGAPVSEPMRRLLAPGATMGGMRPKALVDVGGVSQVVKFAEEERSDEPLVEHAAMTLAARARIVVARTRPVRFEGGTAVAVERFDRAGGRRIAALSAHVALRAAHVELAYPELALLLRRRGPTRGHENRAQMHELFRRLVFNILIDNTDDHEKNHALLVDARGQYRLAPAFDVLPTGQALGYQSMVVGRAGAESSIANALSMCQAYWLTTAEATSAAAEVAVVVDGWRKHFRARGLPATTIDRYADQIDRPALLAQRRRLATAA